MACSGNWASQYPSRSICLVGQSFVMRSASSAGGCVFAVVVDVNISLGSCKITDQTHRIVQLMRLLCLC